MAKSESGRYDRPAWDDEFEVAFGSLTVPAVEVAARHSMLGPTDPARETQSAPTSTPGQREGEGPAPAHPPLAEPEPVVIAPAEPLLAGALPESLESVVTEAPKEVLMEALIEALKEESLRPDDDAPAEARLLRDEEGATSMRSALGAARPSGRGAPARPMKEGLRHLFSPTRVAPAGPRRAGPMTDSNHSSHYEAFLRRAALRSHVISSGYERLDDLMGGGLRPGLHFLTGHHTRMRRAFLDNLMWGAVEHKRPIWYCALDTGAQAVWERMIVALGYLLGEPVLPQELRASSGVDDVGDRVGRIDAALVEGVFPYVWLRDSVEMAEQGSPGQFLASLDAWLTCEDSPRLLVIDSFFTLSTLLSGDEEAANGVDLAGELDRLLRKRASAAVATVPVGPDALLCDVGRGYLRLGELEGSGDGTAESVLVTARDAHGVRSQVFFVDGVAGIFG